MKYFAILKDSILEAIDSKVLIVLLGLSTVAIVNVAGISFESQSAEKTMAMFFPTHEPAMISQALNSHKPERIVAKNPELLNPHQKIKPLRARYRLEKTELLRGEPDDPESDYELIVSQGNWRHGAPQPGGGNDPQAPLDALREEFQDAEDLGFIRIGSVQYVDKLDEGAVKLFRVTLHGTPRTHRIWATKVSYFTLSLDFFYGTAPLGFLLYQLSTLVLKIGSWVAVLAGVIITSFFIPNMLRKGTIDMLLVKPIQRWLLLTYKYIGGLSFIFLSNAYAIGGIWLVLGIRSGLWGNGVLVLILTITFFFAILYAVSAFVSVITRSIITAILVTVVAWVLFALIGMFYDGMQLVGRIEKEMEKYGQAKPPEERWGDGKLATVANALHLVTPRTEDLNRLNDMLVFTSFMTGNLADSPKFDNTDHSWWESSVVSLAWIVLFLGLACWWFTFKDY